MNSESKTTDNQPSVGFATPLRIALLVTALLSSGAWIIQWLAAFSVPSTGSSATAGALVLGLLLATVITPFAVYRLMRSPSSRTVASYALTSVCLALLFLALLVGISLVAGV